MSTKFSLALMNFYPNDALTCSDLGLPPRLNNELSDEAQWRGAHEEDKAALRLGVQVSVVVELKSSKPLAQIAREYGIYPGAQILLSCTASATS
jgi:hypothetical protein